MCLYIFFIKKIVCKTLSNNLCFFICLFVKRIKINLALSEIAKSENITVNDEDLQKEYDRMAEMYGMSVEDIKKYVPEDTLKDDLQLQKALDQLKK